MTHRSEKDVCFMIDVLLYIFSSLIARGIEDNKSPGKYVASRKARLGKKRIR